MIPVPDPRERPTLPIWPDGGQLAGHRSRAAAYRAADTGDLPTITVSGNRRVVPTAVLLGKLGLTTDASPALASAIQAAADDVTTAIDEADRAVRHLQSALAAARALSALLPLHDEGGPGRPPTSSPSVVPLASAGRSTWPG